MQRSLLKPEVKSITVFAPATVANMSIGFDILGFCLKGIGDKVTLTKRNDGKIVIEKIYSQQYLPLTSNKNTASIVLEKACHDLAIKCGFSLIIEKGIAIGSGMGGSASSAVAAIYAFNQFLLNPLSYNELVYYALFGEEVASGQKHADNIAPCLFGGVTLIRSIDPIDIVTLPVPQLSCAIIHPHLVVKTKEARKILRPEVSLKQFITQSANLAAFITSLYSKDIALLQRSMVDIIIEPQRAHLIPNFYLVKDRAYQDGALACSFSGSGPTMFALTINDDMAKQVASAMIDEFNKISIDCDMWTTSINEEGATICS